MNKRDLKNIKTKEVSYVDKPANKKPFLFFKQEGSESEPLDKKDDLKIEIESDGTLGGTRISLNGEEIKEMQDFYFSCYSPRDMANSKSKGSISCNYSKVVETQDGFKRAETFYLSKGDSIMNEEMLTLVKEFFGEKFDEKEFEKSIESGDKAVEIVKGALTSISKYKDDFPADLAEAVGVLVSYASSGCGSPAKKAEKTDPQNIDKSGARFSKETLAKIQKAIEALEALKQIVPVTEPTKKADEQTSVALEKTFEEATTKFTKLLEDLTTRINTVEKSKGVKKSIEGQQEAENSEDSLWPSFKVESQGE